jgi:AbrB family looped-hinge helix DNA binding protein
VRIEVGFLEETIVDSKGRIIIPEKVRKELRLSEGSRIKVRVADDGSITMTKSSVVGPQEFVRLTEGFLKEGSTHRIVDPLRPQDIWDRS